MLPFRATTQAGISAAGSALILGRLAVRRMAPVRRDERYIVRGWPTGQDGRKLYSCSALYTEDGALCAVSKSTWIRVDETPPGSA